MDDALDFTDHESRVIGQMMKAERSLPDEFWHVPAVQELACILAKYGPLMTGKDYATVVGCGALLVRHGKAEMSADIHARMALARAREPRNG